ncbi:hypothetical protein SteCoe_21022 [Stentor coeruleus]|uniref:Uncharacterized protein n=1 Tax=Stentor coeruleus TaxID=5963 RepID=A0A1R2BQC8_9CILI|nr:hypothetical protein SteCoe_21022 [Stentor coeruleus]
MLPIPKFIGNISTSPEQSRIRHLLIKQNLLLSEIVSSNTRKILELQSILRKYHREEKLTNIINPNPLQPDPLEQISLPYKAKLKPVEEISKVICKSKFFRFTMQLKSKPNVEILKNDRIELSVSLYTSERMPQKIMFTMHGKNIIKGDTTAIMAYDSVESKHLAHFKMQICEVSSHYFGGWIYLLVEAKQVLATRGIYIKPYVVKNLRIRAKDNKNQE